MSARWYGLAVHPRREAAAKDHLARRGIAVFLPVAMERRAWSDRIKVVERPLFPGYLFVRTVLDAERRRQLLRATATYDLVGRLPGDARIARAISDAEIDSLMRLVAADRALDPVSKLVPGQLVVVGAGPLRGARGVVHRGADGQRRLAVQVALLGREVRCVLSADDVLVDEAAGPTALPC
jgi:transcriptional antiterminator NusG